MIIILSLCWSRGKYCEPRTFLFLYRFNRHSMRAQSRALPLFPIVFSLFTLRDRPTHRSFTLSIFHSRLHVFSYFLTRQNLFTVIQPPNRINVQTQYIPLFSLIAIIVVIVALCEKIMHTYVQPRRHDTINRKLNDKNSTSISVRRVGRVDVCNRIYPFV